MKREMHHLKVLAITPGGATVDIGFGFVGTQQGGIATAKADVVNDMAIELLSSGNALHKAGAPAAAMSTDAVRWVLGCSQMAVAIQPEGDPILMLAFGCHTLCARVSASDIRQALAVLDAGTSGGLHPPTRAD